MDILSILTDVAMLPWWFWALVVGVALLAAAYILTLWWVAAVGAGATAGGLIGALWRSR